MAASGSALIRKRAALTRFENGVAGAIVDPCSGAAPAVILRRPRDGEKARGRAAADANRM